MTDDNNNVEQDSPNLSIGQTLKDARINLNLTIDQVSLRTKIRQDNLLAIENGDTLCHIPHTYYRGYVKCYCMLLGIDPSQLLDQITINTEQTPKIAYSQDNSFQLRQASALNHERSMGKHKPTAKKGRYTLLIALGLACVTAGITLIPWLFPKHHDAATASNDHKIESIINIT